MIGHTHSYVVTSSPFLLSLVSSFGGIEAAAAAAAGMDHRAGFFCVSAQKHYAGWESGFELRISPFQGSPSSPF